MRKVTRRHRSSRMLFGPVSTPEPKPVIGPRPTMGRVRPTQARRMSAGASPGGGDMMRTRAGGMERETIFARLIAGAGPTRCNGGGHDGTLATYRMDLRGSPAPACAGAGRRRRRWWWWRRWWWRRGDDEEADGRVHGGRAGHRVQAVRARDHAAGGRRAADPGRRRRVELAGLRHAPRRRRGKVHPALPEGAGARSAPPRRPRVHRRGLPGARQPPEGQGAPRAAQPPVPLQLRAVPRPQEGRRVVREIRREGQADRVELISEGASTAPSDGRRTPSACSFLLPQITEDAAVVLLFSLVASGQIKLRKVDGWRKIAAVLSQHTVTAA